MSRTIRTYSGKHLYGEIPTVTRKSSLGRARGISKAKAKNKRSCRLEQTDTLRKCEDPVIEDSRRISNFWWNFW